MKAAAMSIVTIRGRNFKGTKKEKNKLFGGNEHSLKALY